jgi:two-component system, sensor histidine kinase YesM
LLYMNGFTRYTNNIRIRKKLIITYLLVVFLPVWTVGLLLTGALRRVSVERAVEQSVNNVDKIKKRVEETQKVAMDVSNKIYLDKPLRAMTNKRYESDLEVYQAFREYNDFTLYLDLYKELANIRFYADNPTLQENWSIFRLDDRVKSEEWYQKLRGSRGGIGWLYMEDPTKKNQRYLSLVRQITDTGMSFNGALAITIHPETLQSIVSQEPFDTMILSEQNDILAAADRSQAGLPLHQFLVDKTGTSILRDMEEVLYKGRPAKVILQTVRLENSEDSLRIVSFIPLESILKEARTVSLIAYAIILGSLTLAIILIIFFSGAISKRIYTLSCDMRRVALGDFSLLTVVQGQDEIGQLSRHMNFMVRSVKELMHQVREAQQERHELQHKHNEMKFRMLANQVNPHFLFNVLESVRMKAHCEGQEEIANTVKALGRLLRHSLEIGQLPVPLSSELELVRMYLEIQSFRFGERLSFQLPEPGETREIMILPMLLQPLVENAIIHGIENKLGKGRVQVTLEQLAGVIRLTVTDNGTGMEEGKLRQLQEQLCYVEEESGQRIGLRNVNQRIRLYYGMEYGVKIAAIPEGGTAVYVYLPQGGEEHV